MRFKTLATILLTAFVLAAFAVIALRKPSSAPEERPETGRGPDVRAGAPPATRSGEAPPPPAVTASSPQAEEPAVDRAAGQRVAPAAGSLAVAPPPAAAPDARSSTHARKVVATYFHGNVRCPTCRKVEAYAREAVEEGFKSEVASGAVEFRAVNLDAAGNEHFIEDYRLTNKSVVVTEEVDGVVARWAKLDEVWNLVGDRDRYHVYVQDAVRGYLEP